MLEVKVIKTKNYSETQMQKIHNAVKKMESVLNSKVFKHKVLSFKTKGSSGFSFKKNLFFSFEKYHNDQLYHFIMNPNDKSEGNESAVIELCLVLEDRGKASKKGYSLPKDEWIHTYESFFESASESELAGHFAHEWCHKIGFKHSKFKWQDANRDSSVPYAIGKLVEVLSI
jgi:hypothetical protein